MTSTSIQLLPLILAMTSITGFVSTALCQAVVEEKSTTATISRETFTYSKNEKDGKGLMLDKYSGIPQERKQPVLIYIHGGGFAIGSRINALQIKYCKHFVEQGFVAFAVDYRLGFQERQLDVKAIPAVVSLAVEDLFDATAFILNKADEWNLDKEKVIISGGSAGAITCLTAEYDICTTNKLSPRLPEGFNYAGIISHAGCIALDGVPKWKKKPCPMLLMHGSKDQLVTINKLPLAGLTIVGSKFIHDQLTKMGAPHWLYEEVGADHIVALKPLEHNFAEIDEFVEKFVMKGEHAIVHTQWTDNTPDSMFNAFEVVPLFIRGWDKTDEQVENEHRSF